MGFGTQKGCALYSINTAAKSLQLLCSL